MRIKKISLENFRNYRELNLALPPGPTLLHGDNAQGKTNLLEAIYFLATSRSPHADRSRQLISWEKMESPIRWPTPVADFEAQRSTTTAPSS
jgi:DNA replication and repair protein RecF